MPLGIPHSVFLSWSEDDQDKAILFEMRKMARCSTCGSVPEDWIDEDGRRRDDPPWELKSRRCYGCVTMDDEQQLISKEKERGIHLYYARKQVNSERHPERLTGG